MTVLLTPHVPRTGGCAVNAADVAYTFPGADRPAIARVSLNVAPGEIVCVLGPSGSGKTTLLRLIAGLLRPSSGRIGAMTDTSSPPRLGWMAQRDGLLPWRTVLANVELPLQLQGGNRSAREAARDMVRRVGLQDAADRYPHQLSGGMRQRAALARALVHQPALLLLDEPFAHLDELTRDELGDELVYLCADQRPSVVLVTHSPLEAARLADRVVVLSPGPARVVDEIEIRAPRPRIHSEPAVLDVVGRARGLLRASA